MGRVRFPSPALRVPLRSISVNSVYSVVHHLVRVVKIVLR